jgi:enoyl-CoA hydratase
MLLKVERFGHAAVLTMSDQKKRNALSVPLIEEMLAYIASSKAEGVRALIIASSCSVFSAGADLSAMSQESLDIREAPPRSPFDLFETLTRETRPVIAAVSAGAFGGGFELCLCCDLIVASEDAFFVMPELGHGVLPNTALARLPALIGISRAKELAFTRRRLPAQEAKEMGLVRDVVNSQQLIDFALQTADQIVAPAPPGGIAEAKAQFERWIATDWAWARTGRSRINQEERKEGTAAFVEKRPPDYERFWKAQ